MVFNNNSIEALLYFDLVFEIWESDSKNVQDIASLVSNMING